MNRNDPTRIIKAPTGTTLSAKSWLTEAPLRMLMNNLDPEVAEHPQSLVVYGGIGRAARDWESYDKIVEVLKRLENDETLLIQSGKPVGVFPTHENAPRVLLANSNLVPHWANWEHFNELDKKGLMMYGQMTAGSWIYLGSQGIVQGTYETFVSIAKTHFEGDARARWILTGGLGGMGGAQPLAATRGFHEARHGTPADGVEDKFTGKGVFRYSARGYQRPYPTGERTSVSRHSKKRLCWRIGRPGTPGSHERGIAGLLMG